jgi:diacylglycerol kinase family enzyme
MRVVFVSNPRSSKHRKVQERVLGPLRAITTDLEEYEVVRTTFEDNVEKISRLLKNDDLVIATGGDGTVAIVCNAVLASRSKNLQIGVLGYGNFNDLARYVSGPDPHVQQILATKKTLDFYPIEVAVNGEHFRYAFMYADIGLVAGAVNEFEKDKKRRHLQRGLTSNQLFSLLSIAPYYFRNRRRYQLPESSLEMPGATDFFAVNGSRMAKFQIGGGFAENKREFGVATLDTSTVLKNAGFVIESVRGAMPLESVSTKTIEFTKPVSLDFQADGEYRKLSHVKTISFAKSSKSVRLKKLIQKVNLAQDFFEVGFELLD